MAEELQQMPVQALRERAGYSQADVADKLGISRESYRNWEKSGNFRAPMIKQLSKILHYPIEKIYIGDIEEYRQALLSEED
jgi:DNA-binding XRE family transcriptional regulator